MHKVTVGDFTELARGGQSLCHWLGLVTRFGFGKIVNGPVKDWALFCIVDLFGHVRETNYGRHFDVLTEVNPINGISPRWCSVWLIAIVMATNERA